VDHVRCRCGSILQVGHAKFSNSAVCALDSFNALSCQFIRSYTARSMRAPPCCISQAACATIASPEAYEPVLVGEGDEEVAYIDAMTGYANPTNEMLKEAEKVFGKNAMVSTIISIGSGKLDLRQKYDESGSMKLTDMIRRALLDTERVHNDIQSRFQDLGIYFRFSGEGLLPLYNNIGKITRTQNMTYLEEAIISRRMDGAVNSVQERKGVRSLRELSTISPPIP
jgi:hypothetical protein